MTADNTQTKPARPKRFAREPVAGSNDRGTSPAVADTNPGASSPPKISKTDDVIALLRREEGATLAEITAATGWLPHSARAALTGLRNKGHAIEKTKREDVTCYSIKAAA